MITQIENLATTVEPRYKEVGDNKTLGNTVLSHTPDTSHYTTKNQGCAKLQYYQNPLIITR